MCIAEVLRSETPPPQYGEGKWSERRNRDLCQSSQNGEGKWSEDTFKLSRLLIGLKVSQPTYQEAIEEFSSHSLL